MGPSKDEVTPMRRRLKKRDRRQPHKVRAAPRSGAATDLKNWRVDDAGAPPAMRGGAPAPEGARSAAAAADRAAPRSGAATTIAAICARQAGAAANIGPLRRHLGSTIDGSCAALKLLHIAKYH